METLDVPPLDWTDKCETGVKPVDDQHKKVFKRLNELGLALNIGSIEKISKSSDVLVKTILSHFKHEECYMSDADYKSTSLHKTAHSHFLGKAEILRARAEALEPEAALELYRLASAWFFKHIQAEDQLFIPTIREFLSKPKESLPYEQAQRGGKTLGQRLREIGNTKIF